VFEDSDGPGDGRRNAVRIRDLGELDEPYTARAKGFEPDRKLTGEPALADSARPKHRDEPRPADEGFQLAKLFLPADERREVASHVADRPSATTPPAR
jgi:hypothetical protein